MRNDKPACGVGKTGAARGGREPGRVMSSRRGERMKRDFGGRRSVAARASAQLVAQQDEVNQTQTTMKATARARARSRYDGQGRKALRSGRRRHGAGQLDDTAKKLPTLFPESIKGAEDRRATTARRRRSGRTRPAFEAQIASFAKAVDRGQGQDQGSRFAEGELPAIGKECGGCHETFRVKS